MTGNHTRCTSVLLKSLSTYTGSEICVSSVSTQAPSSLEGKGISWFIFTTRCSAYRELRVTLRHSPRITHTFTQGTFTLYMYVIWMGAVMSLAHLWDVTTLSQRCKDIKQSEGRIKAGSLQTHQQPTEVNWLMLTSCCRWWWCPSWCGGGGKCKTLTSRSHSQGQFKNLTSVARLSWSGMAYIEERESWSVAHTTPLPSPTPAFTPSSNNTGLWFVIRAESSTPPTSASLVLQLLARTALPGLERRRGGQGTRCLPCLKRRCDRPVNHRCHWRRKLAAGSSSGGIKLYNISPHPHKNRKKIHVNCWCRDTLAPTQVDTLRFWWVACMATEGHLQGPGYNSLCVALWRSSSVRVFVTRWCHVSWPGGYCEPVVLQGNHPELGLWFQRDGFLLLCEVFFFFCFFSLSGKVQLWFPLQTGLHHWVIKTLLLLTDDCVK